MERLLKYFEPEKYILNLKVDKHQKYIGGEVTVFGEAKNELVKFHAVNMKIKKVLVDDIQTKFEHKDDLLNLNIKFSKHDDKILKHKITIFYDGNLNENMEGAYLSTYEYDGHEEKIVATQFESHYAREAFPCIDEPAAKAVFEVSIAVPDEDDMVLSNMPASSTGPAAAFSPILAEARLGVPQAASPVDVVDSWRTHKFLPTPRMSTYLLAFVVGKFHGKTVTNSHGVEITTYCALNQDVNSVDFANEIAARSLEFYDDNFGVPYPLEKCVQVALPDFEAGAMENWGLVTYRESMLLAGESATIGTKKSVALTVAHELSHQWFGDLVTMKWWDDLWLNESFASVMEYFAVDAVHPEFKIWEGFFTGDALAALRRDCLSGVQSVHQDVNDPAEIATLFDGAIVYAKGARLMLMLIRLMGWDDFCRGLKNYFEKYQYGNTCGDDLWAEMQPYAKFDVGEMMHAFIDRPGYPVVKNEGVDFNKISQKRFLLDGEMVKTDWPLPEIREDMSGHYILQLSEAEFKERIERFDELGLEEKLRLLIDRDLLARALEVPYESLLPLILKFRKESNAAVWDIILTIVSGMKIFFDAGSEEEKEFKNFVGELVAFKLSEIGLKTRDDDDENTIRLRSVLLALDFYAEKLGDLEKLAGMYNEDYTALDAEIRGDILSAKMYLEPDMYDRYLEDYEKMADPEIKFELLFAMTLSHDSEVLTKTMKLLRQTEIVKPQDQLYLFVWLYRNPIIKKQVFEWLTQNWEFVEGLAGDKSIESYPRYTASGVRTELEYKAWCEFFEPMSKNPALSRAIEVGKNEIRSRLKLIRKNQAAMHDALKEF